MDPFDSDLLVSGVQSLPQYYHAEVQTSEEGHPENSALHDLEDATSLHAEWQPSGN